MQYSTVCMTGKSIEVFYEVFSGMVSWYFLSRTRGEKKKVFSEEELNANNYKDGSLHDSAESSVCDVFTFSFRVACFSILCDCFGLCSGFSLSSLRTPFFPGFLIDFMHPKGVQKLAQKSSCGTSVDKLREKPQRLSCVASRRNVS